MIFAPNQRKELNERIEAINFFSLLIFCVEFLCNLASVLDVRTITKQDIFYIVKMNILLDMWVELSV